MIALLNPETSSTGMSDGSGSRPTHSRLPLRSAAALSFSRKALAIQYPLLRTPNTDSSLYYTNLYVKEERGTRRLSGSLVVLVVKAPGAR